MPSSSLALSASGVTPNPAKRTPPPRWCAIIRYHCPHVPLAQVRERVVGVLLAVTDA